MKEQWPFFVKGLKKLFVWGACLFMLMLMCNVMGYLSTTYDFVFVTTDGSWHGSDSYIERVLSLAFLGFLQLLCGLALVALNALVLFALYQGILMLGGYHETQRRKLIAERLRLKAEHDSLQANASVNE